MSNIVNKVKDALHSDKHSSHSSAPEGTTGPHSSRVANAADPRVDSDMDNSRNAGMRKTAGHGEYGSSGVGNTFGSAGGMSEGATGPHGSRIANAMDPRVDSDQDGSRTMGGTTGTTGTSGGGFTSGLGATGNTAGFGGSSNTNTLGGAGSGQTGMMGTHGAPTGTQGPHSSRMANAMDPRVDSDRDGRGALHSSGPGPASNTAGPHNSDMMNKMDPRVDSDLDGSQTMGGNKTYYQPGTAANSGFTTAGRRDPTDAAQAPPSVLRQHLGDPSIEHNHAHDSQTRRNSNAARSHQERFSGI